MSKTNQTYNREYHKKRRKKVIQQLGGRCKVCGRGDKLIIHRIFSPYNTHERRFKSQLTLGGDIDTINKFTLVSKGVMKERAKLLRDNPDNMVLLCEECYKVLRNLFDKGKPIGRKEIGYLKDVGSIR